MFCLIGHHQPCHIVTPFRIGCVNEARLQERQFFQWFHVGKHGYHYLSLGMFVPDLFIPLFRLAKRTFNFVLSMDTRIRNFIQKASQQTEDLLQFVRDQILQVPLPYIICRDFNLEPTSMQSWHSFMQMGAVDLATIYQQLYHHQMPATCNQSTRPDTAIFSKELIPFVSSIRILGQQWFATHCPVLFTLTLPGPHLFTCRMRLPKTWCEFGPTEDNLAKALNDIGEDTDITTLAQWGKLVDDTVDAWLRSQNSEILPSKLPKQFRGRCQTPKIAKSPTFFSPP